VSLVARHLEANGIPTVIVGSALDVVEYCGVSRYLHGDFPLGNPCGKPYDKGMQLSIISQAMALLRNATAANTTERLDYVWSEDNSWRDDYARVDDSNREQLRLRGEQRRLQQQSDRAAGKSRAAMIAEG
jgi:hypothetical protein